MPTWVVVLVSWVVKLALARHHRHHRRHRRHYPRLEQVAPVWAAAGWSAPAVADWWALARAQP